MPAFFWPRQIVFTNGNNPSLTIEWAFRQPNLFRMRSAQNLGNQNCPQNSCLCAEIRSEKFSSGEINHQCCWCFPDQIVQFIRFPFTVAVVSPDTKKVFIYLFFFFKLLPQQKWTTCCREFGTEFERNAVDYIFWKTNSNCYDKNLIFTHFILHISPSGPVACTTGDKQWRANALLVCG